MRIHKTNKRRLCSCSGCLASTSSLNNSSSHTGQCLCFPGFGTFAVFYVLSFPERSVGGFAHEFAVLFRPEYERRA